MKIEKNFLMVSNYNADISWILDYTDNYIIYDRSDTDLWIKPFDPKKVIKVPNIGWDLYDKFTYIIDNYDSLPETMILTKGNIFKYITKEEFDEVCNNTSFTPLFTKNHKTYMPTCFYGEDGMYNEINNSWYLRALPIKYFHSYNQFIKLLGIETSKYLRFAPGSNYLVTKENIHKHPKSFYEKLRQCIDYGPHPGEAQIIERFLYTMWTTNKRFEASMLILKEKGFILKAYESIFRLVNQNLPKKYIKNILYILPRFKNKVIIKSKHIYFSFLSKIHNIFSKKISKKDMLDYRKSIKIYDIFNFFNELELLKIRLNILNPYVDHFVIVESKLTHSGLPKELYYEKNKNLFSKFNHKIIHYIIEEPLIDFDDAKSRLLRPDLPPAEKEIIESALHSDSIPKNMPHFLRDFYEKESVKKALVGLNDDDFCFISDLDEIWNPEILIDYRKNDIYKYRQLVYCYYLNNRSSEPWVGTTATKYKNIKYACVNHLRNVSKTRHVFVKNGGWHFTYQGGLERVQKKIESFSHQEFNNVSTKSKILDRLTENKDVVGRNFKFWIEEKDLPKYLLDNKEKYKEFFKQ